MSREITVRLRDQDRDLACAISCSRAVTDNETVLSHWDAIGWYRGDRMDSLDGRGRKRRVKSFYHWNAVPRPRCTVCVRSTRVHDRLVGANGLGGASLWLPEVVRCLSRGRYDQLSCSFRQPWRRAREGLSLAGQARLRAGAHFNRDSQARGTGCRMDLAGWRTNGLRSVPRTADCGDPCKHCDCRWTRRERPLNDLGPDDGHNLADPALVI